MEGLEGKGHHLYMDISGPMLYKDLRKKGVGVGACGMVHLNRKGVPKEWSKKGKKGRCEKERSRRSNYSPPVAGQTTCYNDKYNPW